MARFMSSQPMASNARTSSTVKLMMRWISWDRPFRPRGAGSWNSSAWPYRPCRRGGDQQRRLPLGGVLLIVIPSTEAAQDYVKVVRQIAKASELDHAG
jgi:hypothetical protein